MLLYIEAKSKADQPYVVDWIAVTLKNEDEIVFDVLGEQSIYGTIKTRAKDLVPWVLRHDGDEAEINEDFSDEKIFEIIRSGSNHRIGLYPFKGTKESIAKAEDDTFTDCHGILAIGERKFNFAFEAESNV